MSLQPLTRPEAALRVEHPRCAPPFDHGSVTPAFDVTGGAAADRDHRLDRVRRRERAGEAVTDPEVTDGEHVLEALT